MSSLNYAQIGRPRDQAEDFSQFCRALLSAAADAAPDARFVTAAPAFAAGLMGALALIGVGAAVVVLFALASGAPALGLDLGARLLFAALILGCLWPWVAYERRRAFDPRSIPPGLLP